MLLTAGRHPPWQRPSPARIGALSFAMLVQLLLVGVLLLPLLPPLAAQKPVDSWVTVSWSAQTEPMNPAPGIPVPPAIRHPAKPASAAAPAALVSNRSVDQLLSPSDVEQPHPAELTPVDTEQADAELSAAEQGDAGNGDASIAGGELQLISAPLVYPKPAKRHHQEGTIWVHVLVGTDGRPQHVQLERSCGQKILDKAALEQVPKWLFSPAMRDGRAVAVWARVAVRFKLIKA